MVKTGPELPVTDDHYKAIGKVAVEWSWLEASVEVAIWRLLGVEADEGRAITTHIAPRIRLDMLLSLVSLRTVAPTHKALGMLLEEIRKAGGERNDIVHGFWSGVHFDGPEPIAELPKASARGIVRFDVRRMTAAQIEAVADHIFRLNNQLLFLMKFFLSLDKRPLLSKPPDQK
jgi:hypothetical protein